MGKYNKTGTPEGNTKFRSTLVALNLHSGDYDWLVVTANEPGLSTRATARSTGPVTTASYRQRSTTAIQDRVSTSSA